MSDASNNDSNHARAAGPGDFNVLQSEPACPPGYLFDPATRSCSKIEESPADAQGGRRAGKFLASHLWGATDDCAPGYRYDHSQGRCVSQTGLETHKPRIGGAAPQDHGPRSLGSSARPTFGMLARRNRQY